MAVQHISDLVHPRTGCHCLAWFSGVSKVIHQNPLERVWRKGGDTLLPAPAVTVAAHFGVLEEAAGSRHVDSHRIAVSRGLVFFCQIVRKLYGSSGYNLTIMFEVLSLFSVVHPDPRRIERER